MGNSNRDILRNVIKETKNFNLDWGVSKHNDNTITYRSEYNITKTKKIIFELEKIRYRHNGVSNMWFQYSYIDDSGNNIRKIRTFFYKDFTNVMILYGYIKFINLSSNGKNNKIGQMSNYVSKLIEWTNNDLIKWVKFDNSYKLEDIRIKNDSIFILVYDNRFFIKRKPNTKSIDQTIILDVIDDTLYNIIEKKVNIKPNYHDLFIGFDKFYNFLNDNNIIDKYVYNIEKYSFNTNNDLSNIISFLGKLMESHYIVNSFNWGITPEGYSYWEQINKKWQYIEGVNF